jgi:hypothetical protein
MQLKRVLAVTMAAMAVAVSSLGFSEAPAHAQGCNPAITCQGPTSFVDLPRADLVILDWRAIPDAMPGDPRNQVEEHDPFRVCYRVQNIGNADAGAFTVIGGALGLGFNPTHAHAGLDAGAVDSGCLGYPDTPALGFYVLPVKADAGNTVFESNEGNNVRSEPLLIVP